MSIKRNYKGPIYTSKDGNVFDNPFDARAADTRYEQNQKILKELQIQNGTYTPEPSEVFAEVIIELLINLPIITQVIVPIICAYFLIQNFEAHSGCFVILLVDLIIVIIQWCRGIYPLKWLFKGKKTEDIESSISNNNEIGKELSHEDNNVDGSDMITINLFEKDKEVVKPEVPKFDKDKFI